MRRDPFGDTADPALYVARPACAQALDALEGALAAGRRTVALTGEPGIGKSMLLALLHERLRERHEVVELPYPALERADLCAWALRALGQDPGVDPDSLLLARSRRAARQESAVVLLLDDAHSLPPATARGLAELVREAAGGLRVVAAATDGPGADAVLAALGPETCVRLDEPMNELELGRYLSARLERAGAPTALRACFDGPTVERLYRESQGNPGRLHEIATAVVRRFEEPELAPAERAAETATRQEPDAEGPLAETRPASPAHAPRVPALGFRRLALVLAAAAIAAILLVPGLRDAVRSLLSAPGPQPAPTAVRVPAPLREEPPAPPEPAELAQGSEIEATEPATAAAASPGRPVLSVNAIPWAEVELDGKPLGTTPLALEVEPGPHRLRARLSDGHFFSRDLEVGPEGAAVHFE